MLTHHHCLIKIAITSVLAVSLQLYSDVPRAQDQGLSFEQAQMRTAYARRNMDTKRRELKDAEAEEESALRRARELKQRYEQAQLEAQKATEARQQAEQALETARANWSAESERLKKIHDSRPSPLPAR
jgi:chromosome segregation ATPase